MSERDNIRSNFLFGLAVALGVPAVVALAVAVMWLLAWMGLA